LTSDAHSPHGTPPTEFAEMVHAQIREAREVLQADALAAGVDPQLVDAAVDAAADTYGSARVHAFIGILVERDVRSALRLGTAGALDDDRHEPTLHTRREPRT
jgi:hypothetical protein